jgi:hypothetical protein
MNFDQKYWRFVIPALLVVSIGASLYAARQPQFRRAHGSCLVHSDCLPSERCAVRPSADGFATNGNCVDPCEGDLACPPQSHCEPFAETGSYWTTDLTKGKGAGVGACVPGVRKGD